MSDMRSLWVIQETFTGKYAQNPDYLHFADFENAKIFTTFEKAQEAIKYMMERFDNGNSTMMITNSAGIAKCPGSPFGKHYIWKSDDYQNLSEEALKSILSSGYEFIESSAPSYVIVCCELST